MIKYLPSLKGAHKRLRMPRDPNGGQRRQMTKLVVVTGLSGSGKTLALRCLEDMGYFAVDNLPVLLVGSFIDLLARGEEQEAQGAFVVDVRERGHLEALPAELKSIRARGAIDLKVLFFEATNETLLRRFSETRRPHPLAHAGGLGVAEAIARERQLLSGLKDLADRVIDTDGMSPSELRHVIHETLTGSPAAHGALRVQVVSFGFKHGPSRDADIVLDVRFLTNPYFTPGLRHFTGRDSEVVQFLEGLPDYREFLSKVESLLEFLMPRYVLEGKSYLTIAIGCTGGRHRSVAIADRIAHFLNQRGYTAAVTHRDLDRESEQSPR